MKKLKGVDVSEWQGQIDWDAVKKDEIDFAILRCGYGMNLEEQDDIWFKRNALECERVGMPYGVYLYSYADTVEKAASEVKNKSIQVTKEVLKKLEGNETKKVTTEK